MKLLSPLNLLFTSFLLWFIAFLIVPVTFLYEGSVVFPVTILITYIVFFIFGILSVKKKKVAPRDKEVYSKRKIQQLVFFLFIIGAVGVLLKIYVGFFKTGIYTASDIFLKRMENMGKEMTGGGIGILAALSYPFAIVAFLIAIYHYKFISKFNLLILGLFACFPFFETFFLGGRTTMVLLGFNFFVVITLSFLKNAKVPLTTIKAFKTKLISLPNFFFRKVFYIPLFIVALIFISYSVTVVNKRVTTFKYGDKVFIAWERKNHHWVKFDEDFKKKYFKSTKEEKAQMLGMYGLKRYFALGPVEFVRLVNHLEYTTGYYYGQYEFNVFLKFFKFFNLPVKSFAELNKILERQAVYKTFWGPFYIDFGVFGILIMFFWGRFVQKCYTNTLKNRTEYVIFYGYLATIILSSFFFNSMVGASSYFLFAFLVTILIFKFYPNNLKFVYRHNKNIAVIVLFGILTSCSQETKKQTISAPKMDEKTIVVDSSYTKGDTRRYGIFPNKVVNGNNLKNLLLLIETGQPITFSEGIYKLSLNLKGVKNATLNFENATLTGKLNITDLNDSIHSENISLNGQLTVLDKIFIKKSKNIMFNDVFVVSDTIHNMFKKKNRGVSIYVQSENVSFDNLTIKDSGGEADEYYKHSAAALQVHGWNNNPKSLKIKKLKILNSERTAAYITGYDHKFNDVFIKKYGNGSAEKMFGLEDTDEGTQKIFSGLWINKCNNCDFNNVTIISKDSKTFALKLAKGIYGSPTIIDTLCLDLPYKDELILDDITTNILVKKITLANDSI